MQHILSHRNVTKILFKGLSRALLSCFIIKKNEMNEVQIALKNLEE